MDPSRTNRLALAACALLIAVAVARIAATYRVFNHTYDEGVHLAAGVEWLTHHTITSDPKHPPLARSAIALGPVLNGTRYVGRSLVWLEGNALLYAVDAQGRTTDDYWMTLTLARIGVLPFFVAAAVLLAVWAYGLGGWPLTLLAAAIFTNLPPVLAHAGVAATDMAGVAGYLGLVVAGLAWLRRPSLRRAVLVGIAVGVALTTKLTALPFAVVTAAATLVATAALRVPELRQPVTLVRRALPSFGVAVLTAGLLVWAVYGFTVGPLRGIPVPAPAMWQGWRDLFAHNAMGQVAFLLGEVRTEGWWYFFPVALGVKTPLPALALAAAGTLTLASSAWRHRDWRPAVPVAGLLAIMAFLMANARLNFGVRHALPVFALLSIAGAHGALALWHAARARWAARLAALVLGAWLAVGSARVHPEYLAYFNEAAGAEPGRILVDSDLDWGQDLQRLADTVRALRIDTLAIAFYGQADPSRHGLAFAVRFSSGDRPTGWVAISETLYRRGAATLRGDTWTLYPRAFDWLHAYEPVMRVGRTIRLYHIPRS